MKCSHFIYEIPHTDCLRIKSTIAKLRELVMFRKILSLSMKNEILKLFN